MTSPYLLRPLRSYAEARTDRYVRQWQKDKASNALAALVKALTPDLKAPPVVPFNHEGWPEK